MKGFTEKHEKAVIETITRHGLNALALHALVDPEQPTEEKSPWNKGDLAYSIFDKCIVEIVSMNKYIIYFGPFVKDSGIMKGWISSGEPTSSISARLRPLTDADWTREIGGINVRAYEMPNGFRLYFSDGFCSHYNESEGSEGIVIRAALQKQGLPFMPYSLSKGIYKKPE